MMGAWPTLVLDASKTEWWESRVGRPFWFADNLHALPRKCRLARVSAGAMAWTQCTLCCVQAHFPALWPALVPMPCRVLLPAVLWFALSWLKPSKALYGQPALGPLRNLHRNLGRYSGHCLCRHFHGHPCGHLALCASRWLKMHPHVVAVAEFAEEI